MTSFSRTVYPLVICALMLLQVAALTVPSEVVTADSSSMSDKTLGGNPAITSPSPIGFTVMGQGYAYNSVSSSPDNGTVDWTLATDATWLVIVEGGDGYGYCNVSGMPAAPGVFWANLTVNDTDSYDYINWTINVKAPGHWGFVETLSNLPTGTHDPSALALTSGMLSLLNVDGDEESVVLGGTLYEFARTNHTNITVAHYTPNPMDDGLGWNLSVELYPIREESSYRGVLKPCPKLGMLLFLADGSTTMAGVSLRVGNPAEGYENIKTYDAQTDTWTLAANDIIPSYPNRHDDHPEGPELSQAIYGEMPDRYIVSFRYSSGSSTSEITIIHTSVGIVSKATVGMPHPMTGPPVLVLGTDWGVVPPASPSSFSQWGYWAVDDIGFRGLSTKYISAGPVYEYVTHGFPFWVEVMDVDGNIITDADVTIAGNAAFYLPARHRYEVVRDLEVDWNQEVDYNILADGLELSDKVAVTVMPDLAGQKISLPLWWDGWAWVSVFGTDDSNYPTQSRTAYAAFNHPGTSYMQSAGSGSSSDLLGSQSEMGGHYPHDNLLWPRKLWTEAVVSADSTHKLLENAYTFASRWDDPSYVGVGDMFITVACPGNSGSWQQLYAQYARGTRIMGITSNYYNGAPGNHSLIGSWYNQPYPPVYSDWTAPYSQWYPYTPYDLLDASRGPDSGAAPAASGWYEWQITFWMAEHGGVRRVYNHGSVSPGYEPLLSWIDNAKTNFSYENWKATDGEVASYVYGRWSTGVVYDQFSSNGTITAYDVKRQDPIAAGYWRVPVTVAFNASGRTLVDINITEGGKTYLKSDGTLRNLNAKRIMDVGYDIRGETVYVSYFWNASSKLSFVFSDDVPSANTPPIASFVVDSDYGNLTKMFVFDATSSRDLQDPLSCLMFRWSWDGDNSYETDWSSNPIAHHQFLASGNHTVRLQVMDRGSLTGEAIAYVEVSEVAIPEYGHLLVPVLGMLMLLSIMSLGLRRTRRNPRNR